MYRFDGDRAKSQHVLHTVALPTRYFLLADVSDERNSINCRTPSGVTVASSPSRTNYNLNLTRNTPRLSDRVCVQSTNFFSEHYLWLRTAAHRNLSRSARVYAGLPSAAPPPGRAECQSENTQRAGSREMHESAESRTVSEDRR